jgi:predicted O-methyltransferase YrrM
MSYFHTNSAQCEWLWDKVVDFYAGTKLTPHEDDDIKIFLRVLYLATTYFEPKLIAQTGTFVGTSSIAMALALHETTGGRLYTIDPEPPEYFGAAEPVAIARSAVQAAGLDNYIQFIEGYSTLPLDDERIELVEAPHWQLQKLARDTGYDVLVVDGDHTFLGCFLDLMCGSEGLKEDGPGIVIIHDYLGIPEVKQATTKWRRYFPGMQMKVLPSPCGIALIQL